ncbi:3-methyl-2-oxobutanoate hydroxymethyltransferase [Fundidesulfovibrio magnetotacticus]|uniref:3-methyl-2-oxobutanoate hydroxymethyltransferase n=1 Tax=Fundidesulfovibrio magnetotacticus TaxID=2730080 RepID=A0A6V8LR69_9BACT|nr:3-methyl-2-oxobutanoate hydroxymethyltransferase [Fundidesulfovibrio magnetotacticus]GFK94983.1 3-methyl-2-oxobutanoate hydroxymethyltransferase [Fundidesulfovibrio magnetotacticus]
MPDSKTTVPSVTRSKGERKLVVITAYDAGQAALAEAAGADILLVGDSLAMVVLGHPDTLSVTMDEMLHHVKAVSRGASKALVVADMPFMSYQADVAEAVRNAGRMLKEGRAQAVKVEGGAEIAPQVRAMTASGIPVVGHLGLTPQHVAAFGGFRVQARTARDARRLLDDALAVARAGAFALVLECVPREVARIVTGRVDVPTIGIGAGPDCDGQVLVYHDLLGLGGGFSPRFVKRYDDLGARTREALSRFAAEVRDGTFPGPEHGFAMNEAEWERLASDLEES